MNGNIFDVTVAISVCLSLTQSSSTGLLGGFLATVYIKEHQRSFIIDAQVVSPKNFNANKIRNLSDVSSGPLSVAVPGFLCGLWEMHKKYGARSWKSLIQPTIELCREGFVISHHLHNSMLINKRILDDKYLRQELYDEKAKVFRKPGSKVIFKKICEFLDVIAEHSTEEDIFEGKAGDFIVKDFEDAGTLITKADLIEYKVKWSEPIKFRIKDYEIISPNTAAVLVPTALNILDQFKIKSFEGENITQNALTHHRIVEALKHIFAARSNLGDFDFIGVKGIVEELLSNEYAEKIARKIDDTQTFSDHQFYEFTAVTPDDHGTSHFSVITANGDAISLTSSINF